MKHGGSARKPPGCCYLVVEPQISSDVRGPCRRTAQSHPEPLSPRNLSPRNYAVNETRPRCRTGVSKHDGRCCPYLSFKHDFSNMFQFFSVSLSFCGIKKVLHSLYTVDNANASADKCKVKLRFHMRAVPFTHTMHHNANTCQYTRTSLHTWVPNDVIMHFMFQILGVVSKFCTMCAGKINEFHLDDTHPYPQLRTKVWSWQPWSFFFQGLEQCFLL